MFSFSPAADGKGHKCLYLWDKSAPITSHIFVLLTRNTQAHPSTFIFVLVPKSSSYLKTRQKTSTNVLTVHVKHPCWFPLYETYTHTPTGHRWNQAGVNITCILLIFSADFWINAFNVQDGVWWLVLPGQPLKYTQLVWLGRGPEAFAHDCSGPSASGRGRSGDEHNALLREDLKPTCTLFSMCLCVCVHAQTCLC